MLNNWSNISAWRVVRSTVGQLSVAQKMVNFEAFQIPPIKIINISSGEGGGLNNYALCSTVNNYVVDVVDGCGPCHAKRVKVPMSPTYSVG